MNKNWINKAFDEYKASLSSSSEEEHQNQETLPAPSPYKELTLQLGATNPSSFTVDLNESSNTITIQSVLDIDNTGVQVGDQIIKLLIPGGGIVYDLTKETQVGGAFKMWSAIPFDKSLLFFVQPSKHHAEKEIKGFHHWVHSFWKEILPYGNWQQ